MMISEQRLSLFLVPQPEPKNQGEPVYPHLCKDLADAQSSDTLKHIVQERYYQGIEKYGQPLMSQDGRDTFKDAIQECIDLLYYVEKGIMQGKDWYAIFASICIVAEMLVKDGFNDS